MKVVKGLQAEWGVCYRTVTLDHFLRVITCWEDIIAVGLVSGSIITLDGVTGSQTAILSGHTDIVGALAFFPDGISLVSGSSDMAIKLWDVQTGGVVKTFYGHTHLVVSVSVSAACTIIASGSMDKTIRLWHIQTEECYCVIEQQEMLKSVSFSPRDPQHLISVSGGKVWQWNINSHQINHTHNGSYGSFSLDGAQFALCQGEAVVVQNSDSGAIVAKFYVADSETTHCCFSPDSKLIAVAAGYTVYIWDITSLDPNPIETLVGHTSRIASLVFSSASSLVSISGKSVMFWQIGAMPTGPALTNAWPIPIASASIKSITLQPENGIAISSDVDGVIRIWDILAGHCKASFQTPAKGHFWSDARLVDDRLIFVWYVDKNIHILDVKKGVHQTVDAMWDIIHDIMLSGDGSRVFCLRWGSIKAWSVQTGEVVDMVDFDSTFFGRFLTVDSSRVWVHSHKPPGILSPWSLWMSNIPLLQSNDTKLWDIGQSWITDTVTGRVVFQLAGRFVHPICSQWDGQYLVTGYESGEVLILDFNQIFSSRDP